jgi:aryl-alcohol dehydrogenase
MSQSIDIQAAVAHQPGAPFTLETLQLNGPRDDEILVRVAAVGLCHTDLSVRDQMVPVPLPAVLGHEGAGIVEAVGSTIRTVGKGDKVLLSFNSCGACAQCHGGLPSYCDHFGPRNFGGTRLDGSHLHHLRGRPVSGNFFGQSSFANYAIANERNVLKLPADADLSILAPLGCGIQTGAGTVMNVFGCERGSSLAVFGGGAVGLSALLAAVVRGCTPLIVVEPMPARRKLALELGATHVIDPTSQDTVAELKRIVPKGLDYAVDSTAVAAALESAASSLGVRGKLALVGVPVQLDRTFRLNVFQTVAVGATIRGTVEGDSDPAVFIPQLLQLHASGQFPFERMISHYPMTDINRAIEDHHQGRCVKAVLTF